MPNPLPFTMQQQKQTNWCSAALAASVADLMGNSNQWTQCKLANEQLSQSGCCDDGSGPDCNQIAFLETSLSIIRHRRPGGGNPAHRAASPDEVRQEINSNRPIGVRVAWPESGDQGHFILISGYDDSTAVFQVVVNDPENPDGTPGKNYSYQDLTERGYLGRGVWTDSYFTQ